MTQRAVSLKDHKSNKISVKISKAKKKETNYQYQTLNRDFNEEPPDIKNIKRMLDVQAGFRKGRGTRDQIANICWIMEKAREFQKNICFIDYTKAFDCVNHNKLLKIFKEMGIPDLLTCHLGNLYAGQEAIVKTVQNSEGRT